MTAPNHGLSLAAPGASGLFTCLSRLSTPLTTQDEPEARAAPGRLCLGRLKRVETQGGRQGVGVSFQQVLLGNLDIYMQKDKVGRLLNAIHKN